MSREARCRRAAQHHGWSVLARRSSPGVYALRRPKGRLRIDLDIDALEAALGIRQRVAPPSWMTEAACHGADPETFYPESGDSVKAQRALRVCQQCPVVDECLRFALSRHERFGVWGGMTALERAEHARQLRAAP